MFAEPVQIGERGLEQRPEWPVGEEGSRDPDRGVLAGQGRRGREKWTARPRYPGSCATFGVSM